MSVIPRLSEEEAYLIALLEDESGIDIAELTWTDPESPDGCFRAWDFQYSWYRNRDTYQIDQCGRSLGKSNGILMRAFAFPFVYPGREMLITAPELNHLQPITSKLEPLFDQIRLGREMRPGGAAKRNGVTKNPHYQQVFANGAKIVTRIPNRDGRGVKGQHPLVIEADEMQDYPEAGWTEIIETMKAGSEGAQWRCHGVSKGVRDVYYKMTTGTNPDLPFTVHRFGAMHRPSWSPEERRAKIAMYGGTEEHTDYKRNIYGEHGDVHNPLFVIARLMACVRIHESSWATRYNEDVYCKITINDELLKASGVAIETFLEQIPGTHLDEEYASYWAGMDVGFTNDPTEILVWGQVERRGQPDLLRQLLRVQLQRISAHDQVAVMQHIFNLYGRRLRRWGMDKTGNGLPLFQVMRDDPGSKGLISRLVGYGFSQKVPVGFEDRPLEYGEKPDDLVIHKNVVDFATDALRRYVDSGVLELPYDQEQLTEFQGQSVTVVKDLGSAGSIQRRYAGGSCHTLDAARMLAAAKELESVETALKHKAPGPVLDAFV